MKKLFTLLTSAACVYAFLSLAPAAPGQATDPTAKLQALSQQLKLTPQQKMQMLPILKEEGPKVEAIKNNTSPPPIGFGEPGEQTATVAPKRRYGATRRRKRTKMKEIFSLNSVSSC